MSTNSNKTIDAVADKAKSAAAKIEGSMKDANTQAEALVKKFDAGVAKVSLEVAHDVQVIGQKVSHAVQTAAEKVGHSAEQLAHSAEEAARRTKKTSEEM
jgi:uncharacterized protein YoxC